MNRRVHLEWAKRRALAELDVGEPASAIASLSSDLQKHEETRGLLAAPALQPLWKIGLFLAGEGDLRKLRS